MLKTIMTIAVLAAPAAAQFGLERTGPADLPEVTVAEAGSPRPVKAAAPAALKASERAVFRSAGFYRDRQQSGLAMLAALKALKAAGADVVSAEVGAYWAGLYYFELAFVSEFTLSSHSSAAYFSDEKEARESLRQMAALLADGDRAIIAAELTRNDRGFAYAITALEGAAPAPAYED